jgi:polyisoprenyl-teichoic acid--peptidoglycan teichoic acid transferase
MNRFPSFPRMAAMLALLLGLVLAPIMATAQTPDATLGVASRPINILLLGADARPGDPIDGVRSDIMAVLHLDPAERSCRLLSVGRDTRVEIPGIGFTKINHALMEGGVPLATETVERYLGIEIDHFGLIDLAGAGMVIDAIGGVTIVNDEAFTIGGNEFPEGELELDGSQAVLYARYRGGADGDIGRMQRQQAVLAGLLRELDDMTVPQLLQASLLGLQDHVMTDLSPDMLLALADTYLGSCTSETLTVDTIPYSDGGMMWDDLFGQELWFGVTDPEVVEEMVRELVEGP